jgi:uncharacterized protein YegL
VVACAAGQQGDEAVLKQITEIVVRLDTADSSTIAAFFKWVSASISTGSQRVDAGGKEVAGHRRPAAAAEGNQSGRLTDHATSTHKEGNAWPSA